MLNGNRKFLITTFEAKKKLFALFSFFVLFIILVESEEKRAYHHYRFLFQTNSKEKIVRERNKILSSYMSHMPTESIFNVNFIMIMSKMEK